jgi:probable rRNA maturation factor
VALDVEVVAAVAVPDWLPEQLQLLLSAVQEWQPSVPDGRWSVTLRITDDAEISALHLRFFDDPSATDVMSFPSGDDLSATAGYLGDIVASSDTAALNASDAQHSVERELAFLALHGLLHLCGHDDRTPESRVAMLGLQTTLLETYERHYGRLW